MDASASKNKRIYSIVLLKDYEQEKGEVWSKDKSPNGHGGSRWKKFNSAKDFMNGKRSGTYDSNGKPLRK